MIETSSKRLIKIKKKLKKNDASDYKFLISSLQRQSNKQNFILNKTHYNKTSLKNSVQLVKSTAIVNSFDNYKETICNNLQLQSSHCSKIKLKNNNNNIPFFQNVKFLKDSRIQIQPKVDTKYQLKQQAYKTNVEFSHQKMNKLQVNQSGKNQRSQKLTQKHSQSLSNKFDTYVDYTNQFFDEILKELPTNFKQRIHKRKSILDSLGKQLMRQIKIVSDPLNINSLNKSVEVSNFCSYNSKTISKQLQKSTCLKDISNGNQYKKIINQLSEQNIKLTQLISEHERQSIKMFIKMNDNESKQIERCKHYLSNLYDKYKLLEKSILKENKKCKELTQQKQKLQKTICNIQQKNQEIQKVNEGLLTEIQKLRETIEENINQTLSKLSYEDEISSTMFHLTLNKGGPRNKTTKNECKFTNSVCQNLKGDKSFITRRDKASSCLSTHQQIDEIKKRQESIMSCSTIIKTKNMKKKKQNIGSGINLKDQFNQIQSGEANYKKQIQNLKRQIQILKNKFHLQIVQKLALKKQVQKSNKNLSKKTQKIQKTEQIIKEQLQEIQRLMVINQKLRNVIKSSQFEKDKQNVKGQQNRIKKQIDQPFQKINLTTNSLLNHKALISEISNFNENKLIHSLFKTNQPNKKYNETQYRLLALQAQSIQTLIMRN